jgi:hypothetical protein
MGSILYGDAEHIRKQAEIEAARTVRKSGNEKRGAQSALATFSASLSNQRALDAAGVNINNITENVSRNLDAAATGTLMSRIGAAEELGAHVSAAASAGVGGASVEAYNNTLRLNQAMQEEGASRAVNSDVIAAGNARGYALTDAVGSLDGNRYFADQDYTINVDHKKMGTLTKILAVGATAAATYFGGPQAGKAVMSAFESRQSARNGDFGAASSHLSNAVSSGLSAAGDYNKTHGGPAKKAPAGDIWESTKKTYDRVKIGDGGNGYDNSYGSFGNSRTLR